MCLMEEDLLDMMEKEVGKVVKVMGVEGCVHDGGGCNYDGGEVSEPDGRGSENDGGDGCKGDGGKVME